MFAAWAVMVALMGLVLITGLLGALIAGLLVYSCVHALSARLPRQWIGGFERQIALGLIAVLVVGALFGLGVGLAGFLRGDAGNVSALLLRMSEVLAQVREILPAWASQHWPDSVNSMSARVVAFLQQHAQDLQSAGQDLAKGLTRVLIGMVLGGLVALAHDNSGNQIGPFGQALTQRVSWFTASFRQIVFAQLKISLLNTLFTALFIAVILPLSGNPLPFTKTMIILTFVAGLIPVIGNLISNTVITVIALSVSPWVAVSALGFLVIIHKVEYFLNARIVGTQIRARAWELLASMLLMEAIFGLPGVIAAPIFYAYIKRELQAAGWI